MLNVTCLSALTVCNIVKPFAVEFTAVKKHHCCFAAKLTVARVAQSFSVRAVRGNAAVHIAKLSSYVCIVKPVKDFVVTLKSRSNGAVGMNNINSYGLNIRRNSEITEAVPGEMGNIFTVCAVGNEFIGLIILIKIELYAVPVTVFVNFFRIAYSEFPALFGALENSVAYGIFADIIKLCFAFILNKNGFQCSYNLIRR